MARRATGELSRGPKFVFRRELLSCFFLIRRRFPIHIENLVLGAKVWPGIAVAIQAPAHRERRSLKDKGHLIDRAMAGRAANALVDVDAVIKVDVVGQAMHFNPLDGLVRAVALPNGFQITDVVEENGMAIHAGLGGRYARVSRTLHAGMTVAAVDAFISHVVLVAELYGLIPRHALVGDIGRPRHNQYAGQGQAAKNGRSEQTKSC